MSDDDDIVHYISTVWFESARDRLFVFTFILGGVGTASEPVLNEGTWSQP